MRHWISLCPSRELASFDTRLQLLTSRNDNESPASGDDHGQRAEVAVPWCSFVVHLYEELGYDLTLAPLNTDGQMAVVLCHPRTPLHAVYLEFMLPQRVLEQRLSNSPTAIGAAVLRLEREGRALTGAEARAYLLGFGDEQLRMTAAALLGQRSLSAGGGGEKLAPGVVESVTNALILFVMESVISLQA